MAPYDSDSSDGEEDYTETNVLLGYASKDATDDTISHLGGQPAWLDSTTPPPGQLAKCKACNGLLTLLLELNGDLPERFPGHERRLYLWGCRRKACRRKEGSVRGIRATRASKLPPLPAQAPTSEKPIQSSSPQQPKQDLGSSIFGAKPASGSSPLNPFASSSASASSNVNPFSSNPFASSASLAAKPAQRPEPAQDATASLSQTFAEKARINAEPQTTPPQALGPAELWPETSSFLPAYPRYHLDADYETLDAPSTAIPAQTRVDMDIDEPSGSSSKDKDPDTKEIFESSMDRAFQKFADRVAQNPEQVLRYEFAGQPLLYSRDDAVGKVLDGHGEGKVASKGRVPRCANCGAERVFELQLMPNAITELEAEELGLEGMEWGTIVLQVCGKDCVPRGVKEGEVGYTEEWIGVQWEEQVKR
ncbi:hypothetical protein K461DRAFT_238650 [Myriangium duriaei CBS 260.36]|uniref:Programmed cell death protein 2 C-terminal domain-containing protein n=1 Tax=Myriangium duriaei CBS 260.36 TaxID=1168546 RepID=A0A9P4MQ12_9PEZI|nr:hypothetical protein K461DRAFT_238650 [Myriangium duriaei CBS 260.36]